MVGGDRGNVAVRPGKAMVSKKVDPLAEPKGNSQEPGEQIQPEAGYSLRALLGRSLLYSASDLSLRLIGFFLVPLYTRVLTPADYGIIAFTTAVTQILSPLVGLGLVNSLPPLYHAYNGRERARLIGSVTNFTVMYGLFWAVVLTAIGRPALAAVSGEVPFSPYIILAIWTLFLSSLYYLPLGIFNMQERPLAYTAYSVGLSLLNAFGNILLVLVFRQGAAGALWANLLANAVGMGIALILIRGEYAPVLDRTKLGAVLGLALPSLPHLFTGTLWRFMDRFFLAGMADLTATGVYSVAVTVSSALLIVLGGATSALSPLFYRRAHQGDPGLPADWARLSSLFGFGAAWTALGLAFLGPELIRFLTPSAYHGASRFLDVLILAQLLTGLCWMVTPGINLARRTWVYPLSSFPAAVVDVLLNMHLIPRYGPIGAGWAMAAASMVQFIICAAFSQRFFPMPYEWRRLGKLVVMAMGVFYLGRLLSLENATVVFLSQLSLLLLFPALLLGFGFFSSKEIEGLKKLLNWRMGWPQ